MLKQQGLHYILSAGGSTGEGHQNFAKSFISKLPPYMDPAINVDTEREAVRNEIMDSNSDIFLLSSENFELASPKSIKHFLDSLGNQYRTKIILFVRSHDEIAESEYNQMVRVKGEARSFEEYASAISDSLFYYRRAQRWAKVFDVKNMICKIYDPNANTIDHFLDCIEAENGLKLKKQFDKQDYRNANQSIGRRALIAIRLLNETNSNDNTLQLKIIEAFANNDCPAIYFTPFKAWKYRSRFFLDNLKFSRKYLGKTMVELGGRRYSTEERSNLRHARSHY